ncbi:hypothetical protein [Archaeoglobus neptunius]|uniref:hypothetical protein n=1 Tax=Archaeoglobus neptunius TaxID=2798580 RepID=UPI001925C063|nr:hypothetical protein [Archaeoglobus neptunius]
MKRKDGSGKWAVREIKRALREAKEVKRLTHEISEKSNVGNTDTLARVVRHMKGGTGDPVVDAIKTGVQIAEKAIEKLSKKEE